ncbi:unnamed protein product [Symbiodinium natans]|uniref:Methyltransferase FkbM domain-containing protein n=1 Tax=Symbiodinium natans TaxID=878477 RepID=A0A812QH50_9DINO|nr:unnamed protein product [Symbiodinium natans]
MRAGEGLDFWSCSDASVVWHRLRETVRYVTWDPTSPLRTSMDKLAQLVPLWLEGRPVEGGPCAAGEAFFTLLDFLMSSVQQIRDDASFSMDRLVDALILLRLRMPSISAAMFSTWPIFGVLALVQQKLLRLGGGGVPAHSGLEQRDEAMPFGETMGAFSSVCEAGQELRGILSDWLETLPPPHKSIPTLPGTARRSAWRLTRNAAGCSGLERAAARLVAGGLVPAAPWYVSLEDQNVSAWRFDLLRLERLLDWSLTTATWNQLLFAGWPLPAILHRLQDAYLREAVCSAAAEGGYALRSRSMGARGVWICIGRDEDLAAERWRMHGEFPDCTAIAGLLRGEANGGCLFADVGANLGSCSLQMAQEGFEVLAVEPVPLTAALLMASVLRNHLESRIQVVQAAAGRGGSGSLRCPEKHSAACEVVSADPRDALLTTVSLDSLVQQSPRKPLCAVKIDVEGSEEEVLAGAGHSLRHRPRLFLEIHALLLRKRGTSSGRVFDRLLIEFGYRNVQLLSEHGRSCLSASVRSSLEGAWPQGGGIYAEHWWQGASALPAGLFLERNACRCARACFLQLRPGQPGCRCWDFVVATGRCQMYRSCGALNGTALAHRVGSWAGELSGNFVFS